MDCASALMATIATGHLTKWLQVSSRYSWARCELGDQLPDSGTMKAAPQELAAALCVTNTAIKWLLWGQ